MRTVEGNPFEPSQEWVVRNPFTEGIEAFKSQEAAQAYSDSLLQHYQANERVFGIKINLPETTQ